jgi:hypothetical protein
MRGLVQTGAAFALGLGLLLTSGVSSTAWADDETGNNDNPDVRSVTTPSSGQDAAFTSSDVEGIVYDIRTPVVNNNWKVVKILDNDIGETVEGWIKNPRELALVNNGTICTNRFVVFHGVRTSDQTIDVQGVNVDMSRRCGEPPK